MLDAKLTYALSSALEKLLRPLVRLLLKHSIPYSAFDVIARRVWVDVAMDDFRLPGRKPSTSRVSVITGLTRKDVSLLLADRSCISVLGTHKNRADRVLTAWQCEKRFAAADGSPQVLNMEGADGFAELVRSHSGDVPARAVLDELQRVEAVHVLADGRIAMRRKTHTPTDHMLPHFEQLGVEVAAMIEAISYDMEHEAAPRRYHRMLTAVSLDALPAFRIFCARRSQAMLDSFDAWLAEHAGENFSVSDSPVDTALVGVGFHYFDQPTTTQERLS